LAINWLGTDITSEEGSMPRVAVAQFTGSDNREENIAVVQKLSVRAAEAGCNFIGFHELCNTVYIPFREDPKLFELAESEDGYSVAAARKIARQNELVMIYPFFERDGESYYNSAVMLGPNGDTLAKYRKVSIPEARLIPEAAETWFFKPGDLGFPVADTPFGVRVGMIICYDRNLPEPARCVALNGADLMYVPVATVAPTRPFWELLLKARAVENHMFVAAPSRVGKDRGGAPDAFYYGESLVIDPMGEIQAHASASKEDLVWADIDVELAKRQRKRWSYFKARVPEAYVPMHALNSKN
jgi:predicted amidohydrolase